MKRAYRTGACTRAAAMLGDLDTAEDDLTEARALAERAGQRLLTAYTESNLAEAAALTGDLDRHAPASPGRRTRKKGSATGMAWRSWSTVERLAGESAVAFRPAERAWRLRHPCGDRTEQAQQSIVYGATAATRSAECGRQLGAA
jgi:hypothetical protein